MEKHIVMAPFPSEGHLNPMLGLAQHIAKLGEFHITIVISSGSAQQEEEEEEEHEQGPSHIRIVRIPHGSIRIGELKGNPSGFASMMAAARQLQGPFEKIVTDVHRAENAQVVCIVSDALMGWNQDVADRLGVPMATFWTASATVCVMNFLVEDLISKDYLPVREKLLKYGNVTLDRVPVLSDLHLGDLPFGFYEIQSVEAIAESLSRMKEAACIIINTLEMLEEKGMGTMRNLHPRCIAVDCSLEDREDSVGMECLQWLDKQQPSSVIYISFGSLANMSVAQIAELTMGVEATHVPFLWVVREDLIQGVYEPLQEFIKRTNQRGLVIPWAPQLQVLQHPSTGLFLSHCGWNSTREGIWAGVPFVTWACIAEQNVNARMVVEEWKIGLEMQNEWLGPVIKRDKIERVLTAAMRNMEIRDNAKRLQSAVVNAAEESTNMSLRDFLHNACVDC